MKIKIKKTRPGATQYFFKIREPRHSFFIGKTIVFMLKVKMSFKGKEGKKREEKSERVAKK